MRWIRVRRIAADVSSSAGRIGKVVLEQNPFFRTWRVAFEFEPGGVETPIDLRAYLKSGEEALT